MNHDDRRIDGRRLSFWSAIALGASATLWFLFRVVPKPSRAAYPCQRAAAATMGGFLVWLLGLGGFAAVFRKSVRSLHTSRYVAAGLGACAAVGGAGWMLFAQPATEAHAYTIWTPAEGSNAPMGTARGIKPGRVTWAFDPQATLWDGATGYWWDAASANQARVDAMMSKSLQSLTNTASDAAAWTALFTSFNQTHNGNAGAGYAAPQTIVIKINQNTARSGHAQNGNAGNQNSINGDPRVILSLLRQLVNNAGVGQANIYVYDKTRAIGDSIYTPCHNEFANVHFADSIGGDGRDLATATQSNNLFVYPGEGAGNQMPTFVANANYMINLASMKAHGDDAGPTLNAKNHYGTVGTDHNWAAILDTTGAGKYSWFVPMMGTKYLGGNTFLFMIDALYGGPSADGSPTRWSVYPMSGGWPSSILMSQDGVACESVGWDFINAQWGVPPGCDNTLHEAAKANNPGSGTNYAPDGTKLPSLGVHEHWNNAIEKKYSRNINPATGTGIELVQLIADDAPIPVPHTGWVATASNSSAGDTPDKGIDGASNTRWSTGTGQAVGQWFQVDMGVAQTFQSIVFDAGTGTDYPTAAEVLVSADGANWGTAVATVNPTGPKATVNFATSQTARYVRVRITTPGGGWWSIYELNVYGKAIIVPPPVDAGAGGAGGTGGAGGAAGATGLGGATSAGGATGLGGATSAGGATGTGGATSAGGATGTGGAISAGGATGTGGAISAGGAAGAIVGAGGAANAGGTMGAGGAIAAGGAVGSSGAAGTFGAGGAAGTSAGGAAGTGGVTAPSGTTSSDRPAADAGGCSCRVGGSSSGGYGFSLFSLGVVLVGARRRRRPAA